MIPQRKQHRNTRQQQVVLEYLRGATSHPTAEEVYENVVKIMPRISLATVYRNLGKMSDAGMIQMLENTGTQRRYDGNPINHAHAKCETCGKVFDVEESDQILKFVQSKYEKVPNGFKVCGCNLILIGTCAECARANA
jgi:Fur family transcriptional regulator, ferric uptake regulator